MENANTETLQGETETVTNDEFFKGVLRRTGGTFGINNGRKWTEKYKALVRGYFVTEGKFSVLKTANYFGEATSSVSQTVRGLNPNPRKKPIITHSPKINNNLVRKNLPTLSGEISVDKTPVEKDAESQLLDAILRIVDDYKVRCRQELLSELIKKLGS